MKELLKELESFVDQRIRKYFQENPVQTTYIAKPIADDQRRYLTRKQTAKHIGYSVGSIDRFRREGKLNPVFPFGGSSVRYDREEIDRLMQTFRKKRKT